MRLRGRCLSRSFKLTWTQEPPAPTGAVFRFQDTTYRKDAMTAPNRDGPRKYMVGNQGTRAKAAKALSGWIHSGNIMTTGKCKVKASIPVSVYRRAMQLGHFPEGKPKRFPDPEPAHATVATVPESFPTDEYRLDLSVTGGDLRIVKALIGWRRIRGHVKRGRTIFIQAGTIDEDRRIALKLFGDWIVIVGE
jgi:hypothetical protein